MKTGVMVCLLAGFLGVLAAYVGLTLTGHDATGLVSVVVTLIGVTGLGAHIENRTQAQNKTIAKIDRQTNGVLDQRIHAGTKAAVAEVLAEHSLTTTITPAHTEPATRTTRMTKKAPK